MTKAEEFLRNGGLTVEVNDGEVFGIDEFGMPQTIGKIGRIELSIEHPEQMLGISRIEHVTIYDENDNTLYDDQKIVDNAEYHSDSELIESLAKSYGISQDIIEDI